MRVATILYKGQPRWGAVMDDHVRLIGAAMRSGVRDALAHGEMERLAAAAGGETVPLDTVEYLPLIPEPGKILAVGMNYTKHMQEMGRDIPEYPWMFVRFPSSQVGHGQPLTRPRVSHQYDFEGELAVVIGREARYVKAADALDYVAGYTCFMDGSVRDFQKHGAQFTPGKNFPGSGSFGPWLVTADEIPDPTVLTLQTRVNGEVMQQATLDDLRFTIPQLIEYCSTFCCLEPGDVILTGTPGGVGVARDPQVWLTPGDVVEVDISGVGVLSNPVVDEA